MNKSIQSVINRLKDHPNVEIFSKEKLGQFVGKESYRTEFKRKRISEMDKAIVDINKEMKKAIKD